MSINRFKAKFAKGAARPNYFRVMMTFPNYAVIGGESEEMSVLCKAASLPASTLGVIDVPYFGRKLKTAGDREFEPWTVTVYNMKDQMLRNAFERWSNGIDNHSDGSGLTNLADYMSEAYVEQLDENENVLKIYTLHNIWPSNIGQIELSQDSENTYEEFEVTLEMSHWTSETTS